ncbi:MAG: heavy metal translocating P-type ATPase, partial [Saprospiraceae bacterium]
ATKLQPGTGPEESVSVNRLNPGDRILVRHRELIPADGVLKKGSALIDYSFVSGEAETVALAPGEKLYAGGRQMGDAIELLLTKKVSQSYLTQLWNDDAFHKDKLAGTSDLANKIGRYFTLLVLSVAFATLVYWWPRDTRIAFQAFTAVLIIACPCAIALNIPFTLGNVVRILSKHGFYLKNTNVVEAFRPITAVVFDKTGTLTITSGNTLEYKGEELTQGELSQIKALAGQSIHPLSRQLAQQLDSVVATDEIHEFREEVGRGLSGRVGGQALKIGSAEFVGQGSASSNGAIYISVAGTVKGAFHLHNRYRPTAWELLRWFGQQARVFLLSGDNEQERRYLEEKLRGVADSDSLRFNQSPKEKLAFIRQLQADGANVMMIGDGLNDAGALKQSNVGLVVAGDTNNFTPACDAILDDRRFSDLPQFLQFSRAGIRVVYAAWGLAAVYNVIGLSFAVQGLLSPVVAAILMPASSLTIVIFGVGASTLLAKNYLKTTPLNT